MNPLQVKSVRSLTLDQSTLFGSHPEDVVLLTYYSSDESYPPPDRLTSMRTFDSTPARISTFPVPASKPPASARTS